MRIGYPQYLNSPCLHKVAYHLLAIKFVCPQASSCRFCLLYVYHELKKSQAKRPSGSQQHPRPLCHHPDRRHLRAERQLSEQSRPTAQPRHPRCRPGLQQRRRPHCRRRLRCRSRSRGHGMELLEFAKHYLSDIDGFKEVIELMEQYA